MNKKIKRWQEDIEKITGDVEDLLYSKSTPANLIKNIHNNYEDEKNQNKQ